MDRLGRTLDAALAVFGLLGLAVATRVWVGPPVTLGAGRFDSVVRALEQRDFRGWLVAALVLTWLVPVALGLLWRRARTLAQESGRLRALVDSLARPSIPVKVDVDTKVPVRLAEPLFVPMEVHTRTSVEAEIDIEAEVPIKAVVPLDTEIETTLMGLGTIRVPVKANVPVDVVLPFKGRVKVRAVDVPVDVRDTARVELPPFDLPVVSRIEARIDLLANLRAEPERAGDLAAAPSA